MWGKKQKKVIRYAKFKAYDDLYDKLGTKNWENDVYSLLNWGREKLEILIILGVSRMKIHEC